MCFNHTLKRKNDMESEQQVKRFCGDMVRCKEFLAFVTISTKPTVDYLKQILQELGLLGASQEHEFACNGVFTYCPGQSVWCVRIAAKGGLLERIESLLENPHSINAMTELNEKAFGSEIQKHVVFRNEMNNVEVAATMYLLLVRRELGQNQYNVGHLHLIDRNDTWLTVNEVSMEHREAAAQSHMKFNRPGKKLLRRVIKQDGWTLIQQQIAKSVNKSTPSLCPTRPNVPNETEIIDSC